MESKTLGRLNRLSSPSKVPVINNYRELDFLPKQSVHGVAIGNFDGVHLGHQFLLKQWSEQCKVDGLVPAVLTFNPNPAKRFQPQEFAGLIFSQTQKHRALHDLGAQLILDQSFDDSFAKLDADQFVTQVLINGFRANLVVVGIDFKFAKGRSGNQETLKFLLEKYHRKLIAVDLMSCFEHATSSTVIRKFISDGQVAKAQIALGRSFSIEGKVIRGKQLGRTLGFPTANIGLSSYVHPRRGVYSGSIIIHESAVDSGLYLKDKRALPAAINIGVKPSVSAQHDSEIEVHIIDQKFESDYLYDKAVTIFLDEFIREERKFDSLSDLTRQITLDISHVKSISK